MKRVVITSILILISLGSFSQETTEAVSQDSILTTKLNEIIIVGRRKLSNYRQEKTLSSLDTYLEKSNRITMIKRGNYAWEPSLNNMSTDRLNVTIDGMQIFGACTDKMDPVTSYVDVSNLEKVAINSGQEGSENAHCVGGSIDLKLPNSKFYDTGLKTSVDLGFETNGNYSSTGVDLDYSKSNFYLGVDGIYRNSENYRAGGDNEVNYSQFEKYNVSVQSGYKLSETHSIDANVIYDRANDIGYPALPMDVSLAEALIASVSHNYKNDESALRSWETKLYFNSITHVMDDSNRPDVPIRMDMPGWSDTYGFYSKVNYAHNKHNLTLNWSSYYNKSLAEMTMYPNDPGQNAMFMYTWPDVRTFYTGVYVKDQMPVTEKGTLSISTRLGYQNNRIASNVGLESLRIFYPEISDQKSRFLMSFTSNYKLDYNTHDLSFGLGYGERAPSVSEGYGFFLFNSFDGYDYIGNPTLKNEKSVDANVSFNYKLKNAKIGVETSFFHIRDYIIGTIDNNVSPMTIGANGVRTYEALEYATIFNVFLNSNYTITKHWSVNGSIGYNYGKGSDKNNLPLISPIAYLAELNYTMPKFNAALELTGNTTQTAYSSIYGEDRTPAYGILNLNLGNSFNLKDSRLVLKYGIENILDTNYSTYADWNNIARQGRNFYLNASYVLN